MLVCVLVTADLLLVYFNSSFHVTIVSVCIFVTAALLM
jgi:hypothetical protein